LGLGLHRKLPLFSESAHSAEHTHVHEWLHQLEYFLAVIATVDEFGMLLVVEQLFELLGHTAYDIANGDQRASAADSS